MKVTITDSDRQTSEEFAKQRKANAARIGAKDRRGYQPGPREWERQVLSVAAELKVAQYLGLEPQLNVDGIGEPDIHYTNSRGREVTIDVKSSFGSTSLYVPPRHTEKSEIFVYVTGHLAEIDIVGFVSSARAQTYPLTDPGNRNAPAYTIPLADLKPVPSGVAYNN